jgi:predicted DNA-binding ribbon-helix-helix protein
MCKIFSKQPVEAYTCQTRSVRLSGHSTSIRLEGAFWNILEEIADHQDMSLGKFLSLMYDEVLEMATDEEKMSSNFTSLLRCACLTYVSSMQNKTLLDFNNINISEYVN